MESTQPDRSEVLSDGEGGVSEEDEPLAEEANTKNKVSVVTKNNVFLNLNHSVSFVRIVVKSSKHSGN